jgi:hypothetical protein
MKFFRPQALVRRWIQSVRKVVQLSSAIGLVLSSLEIGLKSAEKNIL